MIYDIIIGETQPTKYNYNYMKSIYIARENMEEITTYGQLVDVLANAIKASIADSMKISDIVDNVSMELIQIQDRLKSGEEINDIEVRIRELLSTLAYVGIDVYIIRRPDMQTTDIDENETRAYMIDKNDSFFPSLNRVVNGVAITFDETREASITTVVMSFLDELSFTDIVEDAINLNKYKNRYDTMEESHMGWALDTDPLIEFLSDYGYKFIVVA